MFSLFKKFKDGLTKTVSAIAAKTHGLFGGRKIDPGSLDELEEALYTADFGGETTTELLEEKKAALKKAPAAAGPAGGGHRGDRAATSIGSLERKIGAVPGQTRRHLP